MSKHFFEDAWRPQAPPDQADIQALRDKLQQFSIDQAAIDQGQDIGLIVRNEQGEIVAGVTPNISCVKN